MKVTLRNLKRIRELEFDIPSPGVWVVTGLNGSGKTSLFAAIYRIRAQHAFQRYYRTAPLESRVDSYAETEIEYSINGDSVRYHYGGQRWRPTPSRNADLFSQFPYSAVEYAEANGERIEPYANEIQPRRLRNASDAVKSFMQSILADAKWADLKFVNTRRGSGNDAYIIPYQANGRTYYFSEKSFSLGELCVLKLARKIAAVPANSLVLIDEVEMALHPQAQVRLLEKVTEVATEKNLTVLFSTHSATLIKNAPRQNLILLKAQNDGSVITTRSAYPAQILGEIAFDDELSTDFIFYVEDKQAKVLMEQLIAKYMAHCHTEGRYRPLYKIVPAGGFIQVLEMLSTSSGIFPSYVKRFAILDEDVKTESLVIARRNGQRIILDLFERLTGQVNFLPCTPEVGLIELLETHAIGNVNLMTKLCHAFDGHHVNISQIVTSGEYQQHNCANVRDAAKRKLNHLVNTVISSTGMDAPQIRRILYAEYVDYKYNATNIGALRQLLGPIFNAR